MAFSNITTPSEIVFSGNPVIFSGESSIRSQQFATIAAKFVCYKSGAAFYTEEYTYPLADDGKFQFDLSSPLCEAFRQLMAGVNDPADFTPSVLTYDITFTEEYFLDGVRKKVGTLVKGKGKDEPTFYALPGGETEYERYFGPQDIEDTKARIGTGRLLTRKPAETELVIRGREHLLPYVEVNKTTGVPSLGIKRTTPNSDGEKVVSVYGIVSSRRIYADACNDKFLHLVFWNSFGLLESATAVVTDEVQVPITTSQYDVQGERTFRSVSMPKSRTSLSPCTLSLSSGIVSRAWRDWWLTDVMTAKAAWAYIGGHYLPCAIVPAKSYKHDGKDAEAFSVDFTIKLGIKGIVL